MFKQRLMWGVAAALAAGLASQVAMAQCRGGGNSGGRMGSMGGQMGMMGRQMGTMGGQMNMMRGQMGPMGAPMMNAQMQQGQMQQGQGGGGMCMGQMGGGMGSNNGSLSANQMGFSRGPGAQTPGGIYAQVLPSGSSSQESAGTGIRRGQTLQQSVLATYDTNGSGKLEGAELAAAQAAATQRRHRSRN